MWQLSEVNVEQNKEMILAAVHSALQRKKGKKGKKASESDAEGKMLTANEERDPAIRFMF